MGADVLASLIAELPDGMVVTDPAITEGYRQDRAFDPSAGKPMAVVRPRRTEEVQTIMRWASSHRVPVVPRGAGTGLSGGPPRSTTGSCCRPRRCATSPSTRSPAPRCASPACSTPR
ncbi:FAD binding domain protein [Mycobacterium xenopi 4042]|uniref:FAD binding domain protein n=1 Tax=Mycobacterium xenopi 4042 TaxID=1299334 RepID=X8DZK7_MYCXE|nr:FAD binding domain protein [Mycobacterium xenopi 3993]EUA73416.1 FAD binding domain protein [Mycobacterium xenopi 4042]